MEAPGRNAVLSLTFVLEGALLAVATAVMLANRIQLLPKLVFNSEALFLGVGVACLTGVAALVCNALAKRVQFFSDLQELSDKVLIPMLSAFGFFDILFVAALSGFCEEVLFRGVLQTLFGLWPASLAFGFFHDPGLRHRSYVAFTFLAGLLLGVLYERSGSLWSCIIAHSLHNLFAMLALRYFIKPLSKS